MTLKETHASYHRIVDGETERKAGTEREERREGRRDREKRRETKGERDATI